MFSNLMDCLWKIFIGLDHFAFIGRELTLSNNFLIFKPSIGCLRSNFATSSIYKKMIKLPLMSSLTKPHFPFEVNWDDIFRRPGGMIGAR